MGVKERKERERRQRSNEILESARRLFESKGFLNTTLQDVAENAEISVGLIYRYFQSKEDIFASLALKGPSSSTSTWDSARVRRSKKAYRSGKFSRISRLSFLIFIPSTANTSICFCIRTKV